MQARQRSSKKQKLLQLRAQEEQVLVSHFLEEVSVELELLYNYMFDNLHIIMSMLCMHFLLPGLVGFFCLLLKKPWREC